MGQGNAGGGETDRGRAARCLIALVASSIGALLVFVSPAAANWSGTASMGSPRNLAAAATLPGGKVLVAGGNSSSASLQTAEIYDSTTDAWTDAPSMGVFRIEAAAAELPGGEVLLAGGNEFGVVLDSAQIYDPVADSWSDAAPMGTPRTGVAGARVDGGKVLFAGGDDGVSGPLDTAEIYDPLTDTWSDAAPMGSPRVNAAAAELPGGQVLVVGGQDGAGDPLASAEIYNPSTDSWSGAASMGTVRTLRPAAAELSGGKVLVAGGYDNGPSALASAEIYEIGTDSWTSAPSMGTARFGPVAAELPNGNALVAGGNDFTTALSSAERFDPPTAVDDSTTVAEDSFANAIDVLANDTGASSVEAVDTTGTKGMVTISPGGADVEYTPDPGYCTDGPNDDQPPDSFDYEIDGGSTATVTVTVTCDAEAVTFSGGADSQWVPVPASNAVALELADFNEDGINDVLTANANPGSSATLLTGRGDGWFDPALTVPLGGNPADLITGDFNEDGDLDAAVANFASNGVHILYGDGAGGLSLDHTESVAGGPFDVTAADVDDDGNLDLVTANQFGDSVTILHGDGDGTFPSTESIGVGAHPRGVAVGDVAGDGDGLDIVVANMDSDTISILTPDGLGGWQRTDRAAGDGPRKVALGDYDEDGTLDIATADSRDNSFGTSQGPGTVSVFLNDGSGGFPSPGATSNAGWNPFAVRTEDMNGDGHLDLVTANRFGDGERYLSVLRGDGDGEFGAPSRAMYQNTTDAIVTDVAVGAIDGDIRPDLVGNFAQSDPSFLVPFLNTTPFAIDDTATVDEDSSANPIDVLANDIGVSSVASVDATGTFGTVDVTGGGAGVEYTPDPGYCNDGPGIDLPPDSFTYTGTARATATVSVTVTCDSDPHTYFVRDGGSGVACSQAHPCATVDDALGAHDVAPQPGDVIDVGPGTFVGNVDAGFAEDHGLTIRGTLAGDGTRQTTIRGEGAGAGGFGPAVLLGLCDTAAVTLRDAEVDTLGADPDVPALSLDGGSDLTNVRASNQPGATASDVIDVCQRGTRIEQSTIDATDAGSGILAFDGFQLVDSHVVLGPASGPGILHFFPDSAALRIARSWIETDPSSGNPGVYTAGSVTLDSSLVTGGVFGILRDNSFGARANWRIYNSTIDVGQPGFTDPGTGGLFMPTDVGDGPIDATVTSSILAEGILSVPSPDPGPGSVTCTQSDIQYVALDPTFNDLCDISPGNPDGNTTTDPATLFVGGSPFDWRLAAGASAIDTGTPGPTPNGFSRLDLAGQPRIAAGTPATCAVPVRDKGAYERLPIPCSTQAPTLKNGATPAVGGEIGSNRGKWSGAPSSYEARWLRCEEADPDNCTAVTSYRSGSGYRLVPGDAGSVMRVEYVAHNASGDSDPARSAASGVVTAPVPVNSVRPTIKNGTAPLLGTGLASNQGKWTGQPTSYQNKWLRCDADGFNCTEITPFQAPTGYRIRPVDVGHTLRVGYIAINGGGSSSPEFSDASAVVAG